MKSNLRYGAKLAAAAALVGAAVPQNDAWTFTLSPYVWFSGLGGEVTNPHGSETFSADFGDIFGTMKFSYMGLVEARRGNFSLLTDFMYLNLQQGVPAPKLPLP
jgi:hypothetical protein